MYDYSYDGDTGGILLNDKTVMMSKEPRPVYAKELDYLGINEIWQYEQQYDVPYMWAEANNYFYRGQLIFSVSEGSLRKRPIVEISYTKDEEGKSTGTQVLNTGTILQPVDIETMCEKNREILDIVEQVTVKKIYRIYKRHKKLDCFHVAFSGGKDSVVLLELVKKALPHSKIMVLFGDTKMEFPDTYTLVNQVEVQCKEEGIEFYRASSHFEPEESWCLFGPPSRALRWCCSVHKAAPQTLRIREILGKSNYTGMDFVGVRAQESTARAGYGEENFGKKQKGQYSHNSILDWTSAEIWMYIFTHKLPINETYKKGNSRAGCLFCPMGGGKGDFFQYMSYHDEIDKYINLIKKMDERDFGNPEALEKYVTMGVWIALKNGRDLSINKQHYFEEEKDGMLIIKVVEPATDWREWIKTLGELEFPYKVEENSNGYTVMVEEEYLSVDSTLKKNFKQVFKKAAHCVGCRVCEMNCHNGCISFENGLRIENCIHCGECHKIDSGCLVYNSVRVPQGGSRKMKSINSFANHAPKPEWIKDFLLKDAAFWDDNSLGPNQVPMFKKFLRACGFLDDKNVQTLIWALLSKNGYEDALAWGLAYANLAYNSQCLWYINKMKMDVVYERDSVANMLMEDGVSKGDATSIIGAFRRLCALPFGTVLNFGNTAANGKKIESLARTKMTAIDSRVLLYSLYRYAEECKDYYQFSLSTLMDMEIDSVGISPAKMFGFKYDELEAMLRGLSAKYNEYIDVTFTHDLDKITLRDYHTSKDVLGLF